MLTLTIDEAQLQLRQLIDQLRPGEEIVITRGDKPVARLLSTELPRGIPMIGRGKDMLISYVDDDEHLKDFAEYMP
jgi:antitoxin (DNA-binding transcriptional repressor) of toxin-antitoxin stability system